MFKVIWKEAALSSRHCSASVHHVCWAGTLAKHGCVTMLQFHQ